MTKPSAVVVADSISPQGRRLRSVQVTAHRFILAEINTHRMLSRSYRSSRAVPSKRLIEEVRTDPAMPVFWGKNQGGMQAREELTGDEMHRAKNEWRDAAKSAASNAEYLAECGLHKQIANRVLEPFLWVHGVITATEWDNFFGLRLHEDAQPEFRALADATWAAFKASTPTPLEPGQWHLPYVDMEDVRAACTNLSESEKDFVTQGKTVADFGELNRPRPGLPGILAKVSVARCARSSYKSFDTGNRSTIDEDLATYAKLNIPGAEFYDPAKPIHASPAEHQGTPDEVVGPFDITVTAKRENPSDADVSIIAHWAKPQEHGNFVGFRQYRKMLPGEAVAPLPPAYQPERQSQ